MIAMFDDLAGIHDDDLIGFFDRSDTLSDDDLGGLRDELFETLSDQSIGLGVDCTGRVIEYQNFWLFEQSPGDTQPLLLTA